MKPLDISHVIWSEIRSAVSERKCPMYGPFLMHLIEKTWEVSFPGELLETRDLVSHKIVQLRQMDKWATHHAREEDVPDDMDEDSADDEADEDFMDDENIAAPTAPAVPTTIEPSWSQKLKEKMKTLFCMQAKGQYGAHAADKAAISRHKVLGRHVGLTI